MQRRTDEGGKEQRSGGFIGLRKKFVREVMNDLHTVLCVELKKMSRRRGVGMVALLIIHHGH